MLSCGSRVSWGRDSVRVKRLATFSSQLSSSSIQLDRRVITSWTDFAWIGDHLNSLVCSGCHPFRDSARDSFDWLSVTTSTGDFCLAVTDEVWMTFNGDWSQYLNSWNFPKTQQGGTLPSLADRYAVFNFESIDTVSIAAIGVVQTSAQYLRWPRKVQRRCNAFSECGTRNHARSQMGILV